ncbi:alpha/beta fold hydrolase [Halomonas sp. 328]|uniref:alpha/beta fold hydrolase n=1 Tax=Halomonas sp. 328 TaxID=2776704 RepID=UPI0018A745B9|nr:alpha/beta fold hydrolase [Halomonas sp. 328]MBF8224025.1 alpha/beta fold hydrolase [Halomonas sp. 328]
MRVIRRLAWGLAALALSGCAGVKVGTLSPQDYFALQRGDVLSTGEFSAVARAALQVVGLDERGCRGDVAACRARVADSIGLDEEQRLSTLAELWLWQALEQEAADPEASFGAYLESARHAYGYLFLTERAPGARALEDRQFQVRDFYNYATQQAVARLFDDYRAGLPEFAVDAELIPARAEELWLERAGWRLGIDMDSVRLPGQQALPQGLVPAASLTFSGLRNRYRRDGLGAELVVVGDEWVHHRSGSSRSFTESPFPAITALLRFPGDDLEALLASNEVHVEAYDPYRWRRVTLAGESVPLAGNFTSGYGLWLARSGFAREALRTLIGRGQGLEEPHLYLMQPYDPERRVVVMLHGLASSPEAWINLANEVLGDEILRRHYQLWQVYYPTSAPIAFNHRAIRETLEATLAHFDPSGQAQASREMVVVGHSMGGVLARLLVSEGGESLWQGVERAYDLDAEAREELRPRLAPYVDFTPMEAITRAVFIAAPHRGTPFAEGRLSRGVAALVRLPAVAATRVAEVAQLMLAPEATPPESLARSMNSIRGLSYRDPFMRLSAHLPIGEAVRYHSIIANATPERPLVRSNDGVVPYLSAHLPGADSERVIASGHSVQETPEAALEIRRILHRHLDAPRREAQ